MFAIRFFANRFFPNRFFPHVGGVPPAVTTGILFFDANSLPVQYVDTSVPLVYDDSTLELYLIETGLALQSTSEPLPIRFTKGNK